MLGRKVLIGRTHLFYAQAVLLHSINCVEYPMVMLGTWLSVLFVLSNGSTGIVAPNEANVCVFFHAPVLKRSCRWAPCARRRLRCSKRANSHGKRKPQRCGRL